MYLNDHKIALAAMAESVKDADAIKELMSSAGIPVNNVTLVLIDSIRSAAFAAGREAMRADMIALVHPQMGMKQGEFGYSTMPRDIIDAIRALPGKEVE